MKYKFIIQAQIECTEEELDGGIIGDKEHLAGILERLGFTVDHINVCIATDRLQLALHDFRQGK